MQPIRAAIFDLDGLLLATEALTYEATAAVLARHGVALPREAWSAYAGRPTSDVAALLVANLELSLTPETLIEERAPLLDDLLPYAQPMPGAQQLTTRLAAAGLPLALATSSTDESLALKTRQHGAWMAQFAHIVTSSHVARGKPAPDLFERAIKLLAVPAEACLVFEDAPAGVHAAHQAGTRIVAVPSVTPDDPAFALADQVLSSLDAFEPQSWGLAL